MAGHAQLKFVMTECSKTQIRLTGLIYENMNVFVSNDHIWNYQSLNSHTVMTLSSRTPKKFVVITLKFELCGFTIE